MSRSTQKFLTTRQLARLWLVSEATIKRWADAGHLHYSRTIGGHRRFSFEDVARFQAARGLGTSAKRADAAHASNEDGAASDVMEAAGEFFDAVAWGHERQASALLLEAHLNGVGLWKIFDEIVAVTMRRVGKMWHGGEMSVADEHLATRTATRAVESLGSSLRRNNTLGRVALCCAIEDELHDMSALCVQTFLENEEWNVKNFGANTPFFAFKEVVQKYRPELICISATTQLALVRTARDYRQFYEIAQRAGACIVLGGDAFCEEGVRQRFPADLHANSIRDLADFLPKIATAQATVTNRKG